MRTGEKNDELAGEDDVAGDVVAEDAQICFHP